MSPRLLRTDSGPELSSLRVSEPRRKESPAPKARCAGSKLPGGAVLAPGGHVGSQQD